MMPTIQINLPMVAMMGAGYLVLQRQGEYVFDRGAEYRICGQCILDTSDPEITLRRPMESATTAMSTTRRWSRRSSRACRVVNGSMVSWTRSSLKARANRMTE